VPRLDKLKAGLLATMTSRWMTRPLTRKTTLSASGAELSDLCDLGEAGRIEATQAQPGLMFSNKVTTARLSLIPLLTTIRDSVVLCEMSTRVSGWSTTNGSSPTGK
jgi:hypothetical protein